MTCEDQTSAGRVCAALFCAVNLCAGISENLRGTGILPVTETRLTGILPGSPTRPRWPCHVGAAAPLHGAQAGPSAEQLQRAREFVSAGKLEQAIPIYQELIRAFPDNPDLRVDVCIVQFKAGRYRESLAQATAALKLRPDLPTANLFQGVSYLRLGEFTAAIPPLQKVLEARPNERNARLALAEALSGARRYEEAAGQFQKLLELIPDNPKAWFGLGQCYEKLSEQLSGQREHYQELAQQAYNRLMKLPPSRESYIHAAQLRERSSEWVEAAEQWRKASEFSPHDLEVQTGLVWALFRARDYPPALALLEGMRKDGFRSAELEFLTGECWLNLEQPQKSISYLEKAIAADAHFVPAQAALGQALLRTGKAQEAIPHLTAALDSDEDGTIHFQLFRAYATLGQEGAARQARADYEEFKKRRLAASDRDGDAYR